MHAPEIPPIEDSLTELDREMEEHLGESALTLFEALAKPAVETHMGYTGKVEDSPLTGGGTIIDAEDWED